MRETGDDRMLWSNVTNQYQREVGRYRIIFGSAQLVKGDCGTLVRYKKSTMFCIHYAY